MAYIWVVWMSRWPSMRLRLSMGTPLARATVVAKVWRATCVVRGLVRPRRRSMAWSCSMAFWLRILGTEPP